MSEVALHEAGIDDLDAVMHVMEAAFDPCFGEAWTHAQCMGIFALADVWLTLAGDPATPIGFALSRRTFDEAELLLLAVAPAARRRGVARALIERTAAEARRRGAGRLLLEVRASNPAVTLYAKSGFAEVGRRIGYYRGQSGTLYDAITLARSLATLPPAPKSA